MFILMLLKNLRITSAFLILLIFTLFLPSSASAHPLDTTDSYLYIKNEVDGKIIPANELTLYFYMNWFQAAAVLKREKNIEAKDIYELAEHNEFYQSYFLNHFSISNNEKKCEGRFIDLPQTDDVLPLSIGARLVFSFKCPENLSNLNIKNDVFIEDFQYSTNNIYIQNGEMLLDKAEMNKYYSSTNIKIEGDLVTVDKPSDFVSTNSDLSPEDPNYNNQNFIKSSVSPESKTSFWGGVWNSLSKFKLSKILNINPNAVDFRKISILSVVGIVFLLGFLHTIEAGHSKIILTSAILHKNMSIKRGLIYASIFTLTHISDIIIVGLIFLFLNNFVDVFAKFSLLEKFASYALLFIAIYLLFKNIAEYLKPKVDDHHHTHDHSSTLEHTHDGTTHTHEIDSSASFKEQIWVGFISGLAPCVFGWSIFMLILSTKNIWILIPAVISFGMGIFVALTIVVLLAGKFKEKLYGKYSFIMELSPIVSAMILLIYAIYILV